ncbi:MAG TPA: hypothetical protein PK205_18545, partial [Promineifilum sp.]|nr:hypothetical protein [Promineifilum sp.]
MLPGHTVVYSQHEKPFSCGRSQAGGNGSFRTLNGVFIIAGAPTGIANKLLNSRMTFCEKAADGW